MSGHDVSEVITSKTNRVVKLARSLSKRRASRYEARLFFAEGERVLRSIAESSTPVDTILVDHSRAAEVDEELLDSLSTANTRLVHIDGRLYRDIANTEHPQPISAICEMPVSSAPEEVKIAVVLDGIGDPGNAGTIIRTAVAFGVELVALTPGTVDPFNPKTVRASAGLIGWIPMLEIDTIQDFVARPALANAIVTFADSHGEKVLTEVDWKAPSVLVFGSEPQGASTSARSAAEFGVRIPMLGPAESLNVAAAASVMLYHISDHIRTSGT